MHALGDAHSVMKEKYLVSEDVNEGCDRGKIIVLTRRPSCRCRKGHSLSQRLIPGGPQRD